MMTDHDLLSVYDVVVAVTDRFSQAVRHIAAALGFGQHLPNRQFAAQHRRQKLQLLLFSAKLEHRRRHQASKRVKNRTEGQTIAIDFSFQNKLMIEGETRAAVLNGIGGKEPALLSELARELPAELILLVVFSRRPARRPAQMLAAAHVLGQPITHLFAKRADLRCVRLYTEIHNLTPFFRYAGSDPVLQFVTAGDYKYYFGVQRHFFSAGVEVTGPMPQT